MLLYLQLPQALRRSEKLNFLALVSREFFVVVVVVFNSWDLSLRTLEVYLHFMRDGGLSNLAFENVVFLLS